MSTATPAQPINPLESGNPTGIWGPVVFVTLLTLGAGYVIYSLMADIGDAQAVPWMLLILALFAALGFEFVNGFHDTANAVATV